MLVQPKVENKPVFIQKLTPAHVKEKEIRSFAFKCDGKWGLGYRCGGPGLFFIEEVEEDITALTRDLIDLEDPQEDSIEEVDISLHAIIGSPNPKTMKVEVKPNGHNFIALIDIENTHNFLHPIVVRRVGLNVSKHKPIIVNITNGSRLWSEGSCSDIKLILIQGDQFITHVYVIQLEGCDIVLGIKWLKSLRPIL
jgi:hypothetical protein